MGGGSLLHPLLLSLTLPFPPHHALPLLCTPHRLRHLHCPGIAECVEGRLSQRPASAWVLPLRQLLSLCSSEGAPVMGAALSQGALIAIICNGLVGFLLLLLWVILCWACHSRSANINSLSESSPNSSPGPCPEKAPPPQKPSHEGSYLLQP